MVFSQAHHIPGIRSDAGHYPLCTAEALAAPLAAAGPPPGSTVAAAARPGIAAAPAAPQRCGRLQLLPAAHRSPPRPSIAAAATAWLLQGLPLPASPQAHLLLLQLLAPGGLLQPLCPALAKDLSEWPRRETRNGRHCQASNGSALATGRGTSMLLTHRSAALATAEEDGAKEPRQLTFANSSSLR